MQKPSLFRPFLLLTAAAVLLTVMHLAASFLVPILLAVFFAMLLTPVYRWLKRDRYPGRPGSDPDRAPAGVDRCIPGAAGRKLHGDTGQ